MEAWTLYKKIVELLEYPERAEEARVQIELLQQQKDQLKQLVDKQEEV